MSREGIAGVLKIGGAARQPMTHRRIIAGLTDIFQRLARVEERSRLVSCCGRAVYQLYEVASRARINRNLVWLCGVSCNGDGDTQARAIATSPRPGWQAVAQSPFTERFDGLDGSYDKTTSPGPFRDRLTNMMDRPLRYIALFGYPLGRIRATTITD